MSNTYTLSDVTPLTRDERIELAELSSDFEINNGSYGAESTRRTALIFKSNANRFKELIEDDVEETQKTRDNYEVQALRNWTAWIKNS